MDYKALCGCMVLCGVAGVDIRPSGSEGPQLDILCLSHV